MGGISAILGAVALLGFLAFLAGVGIVVVAASQGKPVRGGVFLALFGLVFGLLMSVVSQGVVVVEPQQRAVVFNTLSGELSSSGLTPGTHIVIPILQDATIYDVSQQEYTMSGIQEEGARQGDDAIVARTRDGQEVLIDVTVLFNVDPEQINLVHVRWQNRYRDEFVRPTVRNLVRNQVARYNAEAIYGESRATLEQEIEDSIREEFDQEGLQLTEALIRNLTFSDEFVQAIEEKVTEQQALQRAEIAQERIRIEAEAQANADIERARGRAEAAIIEANAQAQALAVISEQIAANPALIQYEYIQRLNDNVGLIFLPSNSPFLFDFDSLQDFPQANPNFTAPEVPDPVTDEAESGN